MRPIDPSKVPVFILAGGLGTRISEETHLKPKPMIEIGELPILLHIMRYYRHYGFEDFILCTGYRSWEIKEYFLNYSFRTNHLEIDHRKDLQQPPSAIGVNEVQERWRVRIIDTGLNTMTGARLARAYDFVAADQEFSHFAVTYGDGLCDVDLSKELEFHAKHDRVGSVLGVPPVSRWGELNISPKNEVVGFIEKPEEKMGLINGGFFFFRSSFRPYLSSEEDCVLERAPLERLVRSNQLMVYPHRGFWQPMDTLRDKNYLQSLWDSGKASWKKWDEPKAPKPYRPAPNSPASRPPEIQI